MEAFAALDHGRGTGLPFQLFSVPRVPGESLCECLAAAGLPGIVFHPEHYRASPRDAARLRSGVRSFVDDPAQFRPILSAVTILAAIQDLYGTERLWRHRGTRPDFFDKLCGTSTVRAALMARDRPEAIAQRWRGNLAAFTKTRKTCLLYPARRSARG
jgi:uncharacterized protein YbbC (DUF1343 family)